MQTIKDVLESSTFDFSAELPENIEKKDYTEKKENVELYALTGKGYKALTEIRERKDSSK